MPTFAANLSMLFTEAPFIERFGRAARAGFRAVEVQFPYVEPAEAIRKELDAHGLTMVLHNLPAGDWAAGDRGLACQPARVAEFRAGVPKAIEYAKVLGVRKINCLAGKPHPGTDDATTRATLVENLRFAARALAAEGIDLMVEAVNDIDVPGFYLKRSAQTLEVLDEVGEPNAYLQYDIYHAQRMEGEIVGTLRKHRGRIGHIQIAENPGRNEPGTGELNWAFIFAELDRLGWPTPIGAEYKPATTTEAGLGWLQQFAH